MLPLTRTENQSRSGRSGAAAEFDRARFACPTVARTNHVFRAHDHLRAWWMPGRTRDSGYALERLALNCGVLDPRVGDQ